MSTWIKLHDNSGPLECSGPGTVVAAPDLAHSWMRGTDVASVPPKWITFTDGEGRPLASIISRAWHDWARSNPRRALLPEIRAMVIERDGLVCGLCAGEVHPDDIHIDHILPRSLGGTNHPDNLQVAHSFCNMSKGNRT